MIDNDDDDRDDLKEATIMVKMIMNHLGYG